MFSEWVNVCKEAVLKTSEWKEVSQKLHKILSDKLKRDRVGFFADLNFNQQLAYIKQIQRYQLNDTKIYQEFLDKLNELIENHIRIQVETLQENENYSLKNLTRLDKILYITSEGSGKLLYELPYNEIDYQLSNLINTPISPNLRKEIWKLILFDQDNKDNKDYEHDEYDEDNNLDTFIITEKCENILLTVPNINNNNLKKLLPLMKNVMIKYHKINNINNALCDERYFYFIIPPIIVCNTLNALKLFEQLLIKSDINLNDIKFGTKKYEIFYDELEELIINNAPNVMYLCSRLRNIGKYGINGIREMIEPIISEMIKYWFVKTVNIETTMNIWDQLILKKFKTLSLIICALLNIICINDNIKQCQNIDGFILFSKRYLPKIHYSQVIKHIDIIKYQKESDNNKMTSFVVQQCIVQILRCIKHIINL